MRTAIATRIASLQAVTDLIDDRLYPGELATVHDPQYPCITYAIQGGLGEFVADYSNVRMNLYVWCKNGYDDAHDIMKLLKATTGLHLQRLTSGSVNIVPKCITDSRELSDETAQVQGVVTTWRIQGVG